MGFVDSNRHVPARSGWNFFMPGAYWDPHKVVPLTNLDFSELFGIPTKNVDLSINGAAMIFGGIVVFAYLLIPVVWWKLKKQIRLYMDLGPAVFHDGIFICAHDGASDQNAFTLDVEREIHTGHAVFQYIIVLSAYCQSKVIIDVRLD